MTKMIPMLNADALLAQQAAPAAPAGGAAWMLGFYALIAGGFYFLFIAPQKKKQKEHEKLLASLQSGDEVVTSSGIFGTITNVKEDRFVVRIADNTKVEIGKSFVQTVLKRSGSDDKKSA
jgi:preprotein translocase subunit YajC